MMFFITKRRVRKLLLKLMNEARADFNKLKSDERVLEQAKRDAFMYTTGYTGALLVVLRYIGGEPHGKSDG